MSFSKLKKNNLDKLREKISQTEQKQNFSDDRVWNITRDKSGNGRAIIRFLPEVPEKLPYLKKWNHGFQDKGGWYIEDCPTTIGKECPVCEANSEVYGKSEDGTKLAQKRKRKLRYWTNILVVEDFGNPENNGKVFLYGCPVKIFEKITKALNPTYKDDKAFDVFDAFEGCNLDLRIGIKDGYPNYDDSKFLSPSPIHEDDNKAEAIWESRYDLETLTKDIKEYDKLKERFVKVTKNSVTTKSIEDVPEESEPTPKVQEPKETKSENSSLDEFEDLLEMDDEIPF